MELHDPAQEIIAKVICSRILTEIVRLLGNVDQKLGYLIGQLRRDLYILVPREGDSIFGGPVRGKRRR